MQLDFYCHLQLFMVQSQLVNCCWLLPSLWHRSPVTLTSNLTVGQVDTSQNSKGDENESDFFWPMEVTYNFSEIVFYFLEQFQVYSRVEQKIQISHMLLPPHINSFNHQQHPTLECHVCIINEPILLHHYYVKFIVYIKSHSWWPTFYGFHQMWNDMYTPW